MTLTTIEFMGVFSFRFVGWHLNVFMVNSPRNLMCGHSVLPCGKFSPLQRNSLTVTCQTSRSLMMHSKARIAHYCQNQRCAHSKCIKSCWNAGHTIPTDEQHLRNFYSCLPLMTLISKTSFSITLWCRYTVLLDSLYISMWMSVNICWSRSSIKFTLRGPL